MKNENQDWIGRNSYSDQNQDQLKIISILAIYLNRGIKR